MCIYNTNLQYRARFKVDTQWRHIGASIKKYSGRAKREHFYIRCCCNSPCSARKVCLFYDASLGPRNRHNLNHFYFVYYSTQDPDKPVKHCWLQSKAHVSLNSHFRDTPREFALIPSFFAHSTLAYIHLLAQFFARLARLKLLPSLSVYYENAILML